MSSRERECIYKNALETLKRYTSLLLNWNCNNPFNALNSIIHLLKSIPIYDIHFTWGKFLISALVNAGAKRVEYLPFGYDPSNHYPVKVFMKEREHYSSDLVFAGSWSPEREKWLEPLTQS